MLEWIVEQPETPYETHKNNDGPLPSQSFLSTLTTNRKPAADLNMIDRLLHKIDESGAFCNVCVGFSVQASLGHDTIEFDHMTGALERTVSLIPLLANVIVAGSDGTSKYEIGNSKIIDYLSFEDTSTSGLLLPTGDAISQLIVDESRRPVSKSLRLFALKATKYANGTLFLLVVNHAITDGTSIFFVVDTFLQCLGRTIRGEECSVFGASDRDIVLELQEDPRCTADLDPRFTTSPDRIATFPSLSESNADSARNGCIRVRYYEFDEELTRSLLQQCKTQGVGFQALLSSVLTLAFLKFLHANGGLEGDCTQRGAPIAHMTPVNMRRFLTPSEAQPPNRIVGMGASYLCWQLDSLENLDRISRQRFWADFVRETAHTHIQKGIESNYLHQTIFRGERDLSPYNALRYTLTATSLGNVPIQETYQDCLSVKDVVMQVGIYAADEEHFQTPTLPSAMIANAMPGYVLLHAYTALGRLRLNGEYFGYADSFIQPYYDEVARLLTVLGSRGGDQKDLLVNDVWSIVN